MLRILLAALLVNLGIVAEAQNNFSALDSLSGSTLRTIRTNEKNKVLLTSNKRLYHAGETIWFRAFVVNAFTDKISTKSKILYTDLVDDNDKPHLKALLNAGQQQTSGSLLIADTIPTGNYWLRAYTRQMAVKDSLYCAVLSIYIYNPKVAAPVSTKKENKQMMPVIDVHPEGGTLITGTENTIGVYAHDKNGNALALNAYLIDNRSKDSLHVATNKHGFGSFTLSPSRYKSYSLITNYNGKVYSRPLPPFDFWGGQVSVRQTQNNTLAIRAILEDSLERKNNTSYLIGVQGDSLCYVNIGSGSYETQVPANTLPGGITTFFLYNYKLELLSERTVYIDNRSIEVNITANKQWYKPRDRGQLTTSIYSLDKNPVSASVSLKIVDSITQSFNEMLDKEELIQQFPMREMDNWTAAHLNNITTQQINEMLLCQPSLIKDPYKEQNKYVPVIADSVLYIKGRVLSQSGAPIANQAFTLVSASENSGFLSAITDSNGKFSIPVTEVVDSTLYYIQPAGEKNNIRNATIKIDGDHFPSFATPMQFKHVLRLPVGQLVQHIASYNDNLFVSDEEMLKAVVVKTKIERPVDKHDSKRISRNSIIISSAMIHKTGSTFLGNALRMIPGLQIVNGLVVMSGLNTMSGPSANTEPLIFLDGVEVPLPLAIPPEASAVVQFFNELSAADVDFIEVFKGPQAATFGLRGGNGVIYIHSAKKGFDISKPTKEGAFRFYARGFTKEAAFDNPNYTIPYYKNIKNDKRSTLAWEGNVINDNTGKIVTSFTTNDFSGTYFMVVTGITARGTLIYKTEKVQVK